MSDDNSVLKNKIINRSLTFDDIEEHNTPPDDFGLHDNMIAYNIDNQWRVIKLDNFVNVCVLHTKTIEKKKTKDITLILNPITLNACLFEGVVNIRDVDEFTGRLILQHEKTVFQMGMSYSTIDGDIKVKVKRREVKIMELRDVFIFSSDPKYITINTDPIINMGEALKLLPTSFYTNKKDHRQENITEKYHPKTLVYIIQYKSKSKKYKHTIVQGRGINARNPSGYKYKDSKIEDYLRQYTPQLINKEAFIFPMFLYYAKIIFPRAKIIKL
jgi:hypothetical protein